MKFCGAKLKVMFFVQKDKLPAVEGNVFISVSLDKKGKLTKLEGKSPSWHKPSLLF